MPVAGRAIEHVGQIAAGVSRVAARAEAAGAARLLRARGARDAAGGSETSKPRFRRIATAPRHATADLLGRCESPGGVAVRDTEDRPRVVAAALVHEGVATSGREPVAPEELLGAEGVILGERLQDVVSGHGGEGGHDRSEYDAAPAPSPRGVPRPARTRP